MNDNAEQRYGATVTYLYCSDAAGLADWLQRVFGFEIRQSFPDSSGVVRNVELRVGSAEVWLDRKPEARDALRGVSEWIGVYVDDVETMRTLADEAGLPHGEILERPWGVRELQLTDPEGFCWGFMQRVA